MAKGGNSWSVYNGYVFILMLALVHTANCQLGYMICDGQSLFVSEGDDVPMACYRLGDTAMDWASANTFCRRRGGTLSGALDTYREVLATNGISSLWSEFNVRDGRLVMQTAASPEAVSIEAFIPYQEASAVEGYCARYKQCVSDLENTQEEQFLPCPGPYTLGFVPCEQKLNFLCEFPVKALGRLEEKQGFFNIEDELDFNLQFSSGKSNLSGADLTCSREVVGGSVFKLSTPADETILRILSLEVNADEPGRFLPVINVTEPQLSRTFFWVNNTALPGCFAYSLRELALSDFTPSLYHRLPCETQLRVLCQWNKLYEAQTQPIMAAEIRSNLIRQIGTDILAHSEVIGQIVGWTTGSDIDQQTPSISRGSLGISCDVPFLTPDQSATIYKNGVAIQREIGYRFYETRDFKFYVDLSWGQDSFGAVPVMNAVASYTCDYNHADSPRLLTSNYLFVRPTDYEIYSVHLFLNRTLGILPWREAIVSSLTGNWVLGVDSTGRARRQTDALDYFLNSLAKTFSTIQFGVRPLQLVDRGATKDADMVMYAYRQVSGTSPQVFTDISNNVTQLNQFQKDVNTLDVALRPMGVNQVKVFSIDYCWATTRHDDVTGNTYELPTTRAPAVWRSSQTCARDNGPLVTVECKGDKRNGFQWGPTIVNPLCNYSGQDDQESGITDRLRDLAQTPVTPNTMDSTVTELTTLIESVEPDTLTPTDVVLVADVLQKVTTTGGELGPKTVQDIVRIVDRLSKLPQETLQEGQRIGQASNRILESTDRLGAVAQIPASDNRQRVVSGGLGLEVWKLEDMATDKNIVVGIRMLSDGSQEMVTYEELVSQYSDIQVGYAGTDAAIYLPEEFLRNYVNNRNGSEIRLAMNVYKLTSLYRDPSSGQEDGTNNTLNSRVIAAQLLVDGRQITDLGGYKVLTVFQPTSIVLPEEERPNRTTCVYWNFTANQNAGGWGSEGCRYGRTQEGRDVCECDHLTNFAVLVSFYDQSELEHKEILGYITIVGLSLSIAGLALSMLSFIFIKKLRQGRPQQTLFQLSLSLLLSWVVFLAGIERTSDHDGCIAVAAILHYLILASFMWMLMEGLLQYLLFVRVMNAYFTHYMWKTSIPSWGLPVIPVVIILAIDTELYNGGEDYCWMDLDAFYYGFAIPVGLIIATNLVVFVLVTISLCRRKDMSKHSTHKSNQTLVNVRASFICFCVLGLSWIFGFLAIEDARLVFQYLFCITASLQGFIVFLMMTARDKQVRQYWMQRLCCCCPHLAQGQSSASASSNSKTGFQDPMRIPRVHNPKKKQEVTSLTHSTAMSADTEANGSPAASAPPSRKSSYGQDEPVLF